MAVKHSCSINHGFPFVANQLPQVKGSEVRCDTIWLCGYCYSNVWRVMLKVEVKIVEYVLKFFENPAQNVIFIFLWVVQISYSVISL